MYSLNSNTVVCGENVSGNSFYFIIARQRFYAANNNNNNNNNAIQQQPSDTDVSRKYFSSEYSRSSLLNAVENILNNFKSWTVKSRNERAPKGIFRRPHLWAPRDADFIFRGSIQSSSSWHAIRPVTVCHQSCPRRLTAVAKLRSHAHRGRYVYLSLNNTYGQGWKTLLLHVQLEWFIQWTGNRIDGKELKTRNTVQMVVAEI